MILYLFVKFVNPMTRAEKEEFFIKYGEYENLVFGPFKPVPVATPDDIAVLGIPVEDLKKAVVLGRFSVLLKFVPEVLAAGWSLREEACPEHYEEIINIIKAAYDKDLPSSDKTPAK